MRSAAMPRFSSKIPGFISYVLLKSLILHSLRARKIKGFRGNGEHVAESYPNFAL